MGWFDPVDDILTCALAPVRDAVEVVDGLTEGELRTKAAIRLGTDVVAGMAISEIIDALNDE